MPESGSPFLSPFEMKVAGGPVSLLDAGKWHRDDDALERLATATRLGEIATLGAVRSVPGIWSHARTFHDLWSAGSTSEHPLRQMHGEVVASWRGLLAMVALAESSEFCVRLHSLKADPQRPFLSEALPQCPQGLLDTGDDAPPEKLQTRLGFVLYADDHMRESWRVAGLLTPATLVLPARELARPTDPRLTWTKGPDDDGYPLADPASSPRLRPKQRDALIAILERWRTKTEALAKKQGGATFSKPLFPLVEALSAFVRDLKSSSPQRVWGYKPEQRLQQGVGEAFSSEPLAFLNESPRYSAGPPTVDTTDCAVELRYTNGLSKVLLYADSFHEDVVGQDDAEPLIWRDRTVTETTEALVREHLSRADGPLAEGWHLLTAEDLFAPLLIEFKDPRDAPGLKYFAHAHVGRYLLPFKPTALLMVPPSELKNRISIDEKDDGVTVSLQVTLISTSGKRRSCKIRRFYDRAHIRRQAVEPALLAVWPRFYADDWSHYFIWQQSRRTRDPTFEVVGAVTRRSVRDVSLQIVNAREPISDYSGLQDASQRADFQDLTRGQEEDGVKQCVLSYTSVPEALICRVGEDEQDIGLLLLALDRFPPAESDTRWRIAIDYGTTNTAIAYRPMTSGPRESRPLSLANRTMLPFEEPQSNEKKGDAHTLARYEFISPEVVNPPFLTLVRKRATNPEGEAVMGAANAIAFATSYDWLEQIQFYPSRYLFGRKWELNRTSGSFIRQLVVQAAAEARAQGVPMENIAWSFSLPASLGEEVASQYQKVASGAVRSLVGQDRPPPSIDFPLESASALSYMMHFSRTSVGATQIVLDVGGHSTDIAIHGIDRAEALWEGSVEIGGKDIVVDDWTSDQRLWRAAISLISKNDDLTKSVGVEGYLERFSNVEAQRILLEMVINRNGLPSERIAMEDAGEEAAALIRRVDQRADFVFFALTDYVLGVMKSLENVGHKIDPRAGLNFCGRGGVLLSRAWQPFAAPKQVDKADRPQSEVLRARFDRFVAQAMEAHETGVSIETTAFSKSEDAKLEVALGAAALANVGEFASAKGRYPLPQGESVRLNSGGLGQEDFQAEPTQAITKQFVKDAGPNLRFTSAALDFPAFRGFLTRYADSLSDLKIRGAQIEIKTQVLPSEIINVTATRFSSFLEEARTAERPSGFIQPIFMAAVKASLERWDELVRQKS